MGFSHSWTLPDECDPIAFDRAVTDMDRMVKWLAHGAPFAGENEVKTCAECSGLAMLYLRSDGVAFADPADAGSVFCVDRDISLNEMSVRRGRVRLLGSKNTSAKRRGYFKPLGSPANLAVCCCLIILKKHLGREFDVASDVEGDGWRRAAAACQEVLGYGGGAAIGSDGVLRLVGGQSDAVAAVDRGTSP